MDEQALHKCLILSKLAYRDKFHYELLGFDHVTFIENEETQLYIVEDGDSVYYAFRGTELAEWKDIITDVRASKKNFRTGHMHRGFYDAFSAVRDELFRIRRVRDLKHKKTYITGHSLGGALARILSEYLSDVEAVHTFGEPRSGCKVLAAAYRHHDVHYRWVIHNDIVARLPLVSMHFADVGKIMYVNRNNEICPESTRLLRNWEFMRGGIGSKLKDHYMDTYLHTLGPLFIRNKDKLKDL